MNQADPETVKAFVIAGHHDLEKVKAILEENPTLLEAKAPWNETALQAACHMGRRDIAAWLLERGAQPDLCCWAAMGEVEKVRQALEADPESASYRGVHGMSVLMHAAFGGSLEVAKLLLDYGADTVNEPDGASSPLHGAAMRGDKALVQLLLEHGARKDAKGFDGKTPAEVAQEAGNAEVARLLSS